MITDLGVLRPDPDTHELVLASIHPGVELGEVETNTGWPLRIAPALVVADPPDSGQLAALRSLSKRSAEAHGR